MGPKPAGDITPKPTATPDAGLNKIVIVTVGSSVTSGAAASWRSTCGWLFHTFGMSGVTGLNIYSLIVAVVGAAVFLVIYHLISRGGSRGLNP